MRRSTHMGTALIVLMALLFGPGCDDDGTPVNPGGIVPQITSVSPNPIVASPAAQTVTVSGNQFAAGLRLVITAPDGSSTAVQGDDIQDVQPTSFRARLVVNQQGTHAFVVENDNGAQSEGFAVSVEVSSTAQPVITTVTPSSLPRSISTTVVALMGQNFRTGATVNVVDPAGATATVGASSIGLQSATRIEFGFVFDTAGIYTVLVRNPDGEISNGASITVN